MATLRTIGYEAASPDALLAALRDAGVARVVDVRAVPISRKRDFSKDALRDFLHANGIGYVHVGALGTPKRGREAAKAGRRAEFRRVYREHLDTAEAQAALREVAGHASASPACLLCLERDAAACHRSMVALELASAHGFAIEHLTVGERAPSPGPGPRQGG